MYSGASCIFWMADVNLGQSSSAGARCAGVADQVAPTEGTTSAARAASAHFHREHRDRHALVNGHVLADIEANEVLPIDGRPATIHEVARLQSRRLESRSAKPVGTPVTSEGFARSNSSCIRSTTLVSSGWISMNP